ncbi:MAG TPA: hypothetical protein ENG39_01605, partial [Candidatus Omnitrophica bacterium]|nr:hypothetical protein [Candidatus Omnitrophota bacterium]
MDRIKSLKIMFFFSFLLLIFVFTYNVSDKLSFRRIRPQLTETLLRLQAILEDPTGVIEDEELIKKGILDELLRINPEYAHKYEQKAKGILVKIYKEVREGKRRIFPRGLWQGEQGKINAKVIIRYVVEEVEGWSLPDLPKMRSNWGNWFHKEIGLGGMLGRKFHNSPLEAFKFAYPEYFWDKDNWDKPFLWFDHDFSPKGIWEDPAYDDYVRKLIRYYVEKVEGWSLPDLPKMRNDWRDWFRK